MNRATIIALVVLVAVLSSAAIATVKFRENGRPALTDEQRATREKFFGSGKELPPIKEGQEMRPRW